MKRLSLLFLFFSLGLRAQEYNYPQQDSWKDLLTSFQLAVDASYLQFYSSSLAYEVPAAAGLLWWSFEEDDDVLAQYGRKKKNTGFDILDGAGIVTNSPLLPLLFYIPGRMRNDLKMQQFSMEVAAALVLTSVETVLISLFDVHDRPDTSDLSAFETSFRGDSSFPSGHILPSMILTYKTIEFYGWYGVLPGILALSISYERVQSQKHYFSDIMGGLVLAYFASRGVSRAVGREASGFTFRPIFSHDRVAAQFQYAF